MSSLQTSSSGRTSDREPSLYSTCEINFTLHTFTKRKGRYMHRDVIQGAISHLVRDKLDMSIMEGT